MLNELLTLERGMAAGGYGTTALHPDLSRLQNGDVVRVRLSADGEIAEIELLDGRTRSEIWTLRDGKQNGFPGMKTSAGLIALDPAAREAHDARWKAARTPAAKRAEIERLAESGAPVPGADEWPKAGHRARIGERLEALRPLEAVDESRAVPAAFERFLLALSLGPPFLHRLCAHLLDRAASGGDEWLSPVRAALVGPVPLAIDITRDFICDAGDPCQTGAVSRVLADSAAKMDSSVGNGGICALTGARTRILEGPFPQPTLPGLGQTYLFSRNADIHALARYGRKGPESFPVDAEVVGRFSDALASITGKERRGKTWRLLPSETGDRQDLFIVFIASATDVAAAESLAAGNWDDDEVSADPVVLRSQTETASAQLVGLWKGVADKAGPGERARILILRTVDPGNRKAVYDRSVAVGDLHRAAQIWTEAMRNIPDGITFRGFRDRKLVDRQPKVEAPLALVPLSRRLYIRGGREAIAAPGLSYAVALALFLDEGGRERQARRVLRLLLNRQGGLLSNLVHAAWRRQLPDFDPRTTGQADALRCIAWLGALLFFLDQKKENYMKDAGFRLGQLLSAADALHAGYCAEVRDGKLPPTLIGNSVFAAAGRDPERALAILQTRWKPYHAWADRLSKEKTALAGEENEKRRRTRGRTLSQFSLAKRLCAELQPALAGMKAQGRPIDDTFRAELLLGYIAGIRRETPDADTKDIIA